MAALFVGWALASSAFAASGPLQLQRISPTGGNVRPAQEIVFQFDRPMAKLGNMRRDQKDLPITITPSLPCQWRWLDTTELACRLPGAATFRPATRYSVTVAATMRALDGSTLDHDVTAHFTTTRPRVLYTTFRGWRSPTRPAFLVRFNLPVTAAEASHHLAFSSTKADSTAALALPYQTRRARPLWLSVPGAPGAMVYIPDPTPSQPVDADKLAGEARRQWLVVPAKPLEASSPYRLTLTAGLKTPLGPLGGTDAERPNNAFGTYGAPQFTGVRCVHEDDDSTRCLPGRVRLTFNVPVPSATLAAATWDPQPVPPAAQSHAWQGYAYGYRDGQVRGSRHGQYSPPSYALPFPLDANTTYRVTLPAGSKDAFDRTFAKSHTITFTTGHRQPSFDPPPRWSVLEAGEPTHALMRFTNLGKLKLDYHLRTADSADDSAKSRQTADLLQTIKQPVKRDQIVTVPVGMRALLGRRSGVLSGYLHADGNAGQNLTGDKGRPIFGEVTPWEVFAKIGHFNSLAWVKSFASGQPIADARVRLMTGPSEPFGKLVPVPGMEATTDARGLAVLPGSKSLKEGWINGLGPDDDYFLQVDDGKDISILPLTWGFQRYIGEASDYDVFADQQPLYGHMRVWAVTEQGLYRSDSDVRLAAFARNVSNTALIAPPDKPWTLSIVDPGGNTVFEQENVSLSDWGGIDATYHVPQTARHGLYTIKLGLAGKNPSLLTAGHFRVTDFVPASFQVHVQIHGKRFGPGDIGKADAQAALHSGGPYTDAAVKFLTRIDAESFTPDTPQTRGFTFQANPPDAPDSQTIAKTHAELDHAGRTGTTLTLPTTSAIHYGRITLQASVESARGTWVAQQATANFLARDRFVGLRSDDWLLTAGKPALIHFLVVDADGQPQAGSHVDITLQRQVIDRTRIKNGTGRFVAQSRTRWETVDQCSAISTITAGQCSLTPKKAGDYRFRATVTDTHGRKQVTRLRTFATGSDFVVWQQSKSVRLTADKSSYRPGDTAHVLLQNPYSTPVDALVTVERYGVLWKKIVHLDTGAPVIDVPIKASYFPGAYLSVTLYSPRVAQPSDSDLGKPEIAMGYLPLKIAGSGDSLDVTVSTGQTTYKPRQKVHVNVTVKDRQGVAQGDVRLIALAVDQAVVDLLPEGGAYYDPRSAFYAPPDGADMANYSLAEQLLVNLKPQWGKGETSGGGGGATSAGPNTRHIFKYATYWNTHLTTDADGRASFSFKLPDNLTRWRIVVIALSRAQAMGLGHAGVRVNLPIQIRPALPNQVRVGDDFSAGFSVGNRTDTDHHVDVSIAASGPIEGKQAKADDSATIAAYGHALSWLPLHADATGRITLTARATAGPLTDAIEKHVPVAPAGTTVTAARYGSTVDSKVTVTAHVPKDAIPGTAKVSVHLAPTLIGNLTGAFASLRDTRLKDWETTLSRGLLAADYLKLRPALGDTFHWPDADQATAALVSRAADFQAPDGGMSFWVPRDDFVSRYLSVYTALAFNWLDAMGYPVPENVRSKLQRYLQKEILGWSPEKGSNAAIAAPILKAGALAALAPSGTLHAGQVAALLPQASRLGLFGQALLLDAALDVQDQDSARTLVKTLLAQAEESGGAISFNEARHGVYLDLLATPLRANCAVLDALVNYHRKGADPGLVGDTPAKSMRWINAQRRHAGGWPNSQENVFCTQAITHYATAFEPDVQDLSGTVTRAGDTLGTARFKAAHAAAQIVSGAAMAPGKDFNVGIDHGGKGRLYYQLLLNYAVPADTLPAATAGMSIKRVYHVERDGQWHKVDDGITLQRGDIVRVDLLVSNPTERHHVVLTDPLPGAFEVVNQQLATAPGFLASSRPDALVLMFNGGAWPSGEVVNNGFYHRDTAFDAVRFYAGDLMAGHYHLIYTAQVIAPGKFIAPAPLIKEIYQPDVFGRGTATHVHVATPAK